MSAMRVIRLVPRTVYDTVVLLETDDGLEAEAAVMDWYNDHRHDNVDRLSAAEHPRIEGVHASHTAPDERGRCTACGAWLTNGSYGSHLPCGHTDKRSLFAQIEDWRDRRDGAR